MMVVLLFMMTTIMMMTMMMMTMSVMTMSDQSNVWNVMITNDDGGHEIVNSTKVPGVKEEKHKSVMRILWANRLSA